MQDHSPSTTAYNTAVMRAAHQLLDDPLVLPDPLALDIVGTRDPSVLTPERDAIATRIYGYLRAFVVARSRCVEDELALAVARGVRQYVILGAGLDTFAYRNPFSAQGLRVFEVDHPATQQWKLDRLQAAGIAIPQGAVHVSVDFESQSLPARLQEAGLRAEVPTLFSWLGVTMYLSLENIMATLRYVRSTFPAGSGIIFDYLTTPPPEDRARQMALRSLAGQAESKGEVWKSVFEPGQLQTQVAEVGFARALDMGPDEINQGYFSGRADGLAVGRMGRLMLAWV